MELTVSKVTSALVIREKVGLTDAGLDKIGNLTLKNVKTAAVDQDVYDVASQIGAILKHPVVGILRQDGSELVNA